mmetsp:Transcript_28714/g.72198  ORF Transcript_28714/g.72198 Transcript_28714/m.72198 type:complete len:103 (+) Transcript_28714:212-520(+)
MSSCQAVAERLHCSHDEAVSARCTRCERSLASHAPTRRLATRLLLGHCCRSRLGAQPAGEDGRAEAKLTHRLMTLHAQLTEAWYSAIGALLAAEAEAQALAE